jgi:hypothetical protein
MSPVELTEGGEEGGREAKSYDREKACTSLNHSIRYVGTLSFPALETNGDPGRQKRILHQHMEAVIENNEGSVRVLQSAFELGQPTMNG